MNILLTIFIIITSLLFVFFVALLVFYISIRYREDIKSEETKHLIRLLTKLKK